MLLVRRTQQLLNTFCRSLLNNLIRLDGGVYREKWEKLYQEVRFWNNFSTIVIKLSCILYPIFNQLIQPFLFLCVIDTFAFTAVQVYCQSSYHNTCSTILFSSTEKCSIYKLFLLLGSWWNRSFCFSGVLNQTLIILCFLKANFLKANLSIVH